MQDKDYAGFKKFVTDEFKTIGVSKYLFTKARHYMDDGCDFGGIFKYRNKMFAFKLCSWHNDDKYIRIYPIVISSVKHWRTIYSRSLDIPYEPGLFIGVRLPKANKYEIGNTVLAYQFGMQIPCRIIDIYCSSYKIKYYVEPLESLKCFGLVALNNKFMCFESNIKPLDSGI